MGGKTPKQQTINTDPWTELQPFLKDVYGEAERLYRQGGQSFFPYSTVVPNAPQTDMANRLTTQQAMDPRLVQQAAQEYSKTAGGGYVGQGPANDYYAGVMGGDTRDSPYLKGMYENRLNDLRSNLGSVYQGAGGTGSGIEAQMFGQGATQALQDVYGSHYERALDREMGAAGALTDTYGRERQQQMAAAAGLPAMYQAQFMPAQALYGVGQQQQDLYGRHLQDQMARFQHYQQEPWANAQRYAQMLSGVPSGTQQTQPLYSGSPLAGALGGAASGAGLASGFGLMGGAGAAMSPWAWPLIGGAALAGSGLF